MEEKKAFRILYFISILIIVIGHVTFGRIPGLDYLISPYAFNSALFIFTSGYFYVKNINRSPLEIIKRKTTHILIPFLIVNLIFGIIISFLLNEGFMFDNAEKLNLHSYFVSSFVDSHQYIFNISFWYLFTLYIVEIISIPFLYVLKKNINYIYAIYIVMLSLGILGIEFAIKGYNSGLSLLLSRTAYFLPFFGLGMLYSIKLEKKDKLNNLIYFSILLFVILLSNYIYHVPLAFMPSWGQYNNFYMPVILGYVGIALFLRISKILVPLLKDNKIINYISKNTLYIVLFHYFGFFLLNCLFYILYKMNILHSFDINLFYTDCFYFYIPQKIESFKILYIIFGIFFSLSIAYIVNTIKDIIKSKL